jgi:hypothetical protein
MLPHDYLGGTQMVIAITTIEGTREPSAMGGEQEQHGNFL